MDFESIFAAQAENVSNEYGSEDGNQVMQLMKAMAAGEGGTDISQYQGGQALQLQSLEGTLALLTSQMSDCVLFNDVPKSGAASTLEEYSLQLGYGQEGGFVGQMEVPLESDPILKREFAVMKYMRHMWKFSDILPMVSTITPAETLAKQSSVMGLTRRANMALYNGNSSLIPDQFDGLQTFIENQAPVDHTIDMRGSALSELIFRQAAELITANFGQVNGAKAYASPGGMTAIDTVLANAGSATVQRYIQGTVGDDGGISLGSGVKAIHTSFGTMIPRVDKFIAELYEGRKVPKIPSPSNPRNLIEGKTSSRAPNTPSITVDQDSGTVAGSKWTDAATYRKSGTNKGDYSYRVAAGNKYGLSTACTAAKKGSGDVAEGKAINVTITPNPTSSFPASYYEVYGELSEGSGVTDDYYMIGRIADSGNATTVYVDKNEILPGFTRIFIADLSSTGERRTFVLKRLAALHSQEYSRIGPFRWGTANMYATTIGYEPRRFVQIVNVPVSVQSKSPLLSI